MPPHEPHRDEQGRLTRAGMEAVIATGGTVAWQGRNLSRLEDLPTGADLAKGDTVREQQERDRLLAQRQAIDNELAKLGVSAATPGEDGREELKQLAEQRQKTEPVAIPENPSQEGPAPTSFRGPVANPGTPAASPAAAATPAARAQNPKEEKR